MRWRCQARLGLAAARLRRKALREVASAGAVVQKEAVDERQEEDPKPGHTQGTPQRQSCKARVSGYRQGKGSPPAPRVVYRGRGPRGGITASGDRAQMQSTKHARAEPVQRVGQAQVQTMARGVIVTKPH